MANPQTKAERGLIEDEYQAHFPTSRELYSRAVKSIPSGINHDVRRMDPFPIYMDRAAGSKKWDVDGHELIDYVVKMVPVAEMVRFVNSGTEATMLAKRVARGYTRRPVIARIQGHFHGWHDYAMVGWRPPYEVHTSAGIPDSLDSSIRSVPINDLDALEAALAPGDVAGFIIEPDGPIAGSVPMDVEYLRAARDLTERYGTLFIFDEVITGFRMTPGGAQQYFGVMPDLCTYAKTIAGGVAGGAVAGRADIMSTIAFRDDPHLDRYERVAHMGTFSAWPVGAAAGLATLRELEDGSVQDKVAATAGMIRDGMSGVLAERGVGGRVYGARSNILILIGDPGDLLVGMTIEEFTSSVTPERLLAAMDPKIRFALHRSMLIQGVDFLAGNHGWLSSAHDEQDVQKTIEAFDISVERLVAEGTVGSSAS